MRTWLIEIPARECEDLLESAPLGRLGVVIDGRPEIFPVSHVFDRDQGCVMFPSNEGTKMHAALAWPWVAFEVDGIGADGSGGWSVLVVGRAEEMSEPDLMAAAAARRGAPWRTGPGVTWMRIVASKVTGRRISATAD